MDNQYAVLLHSLLENLGDIIFISLISWNINYSSLSNKMFYQQNVLNKRKSSVVEEARGG